MVKSYVVETRFNMTFARAYIEKGDILLYDPNNNHKVSVYRNQKLVTTCNAPKAVSVPALEADKWIREVKEVPAAKKAVVPASIAPAPKTAAPAPKPEPKECPTCGYGLGSEGDCTVCGFAGPILDTQIADAGTVDQKVALIDTAIGKLEWVLSNFNRPLPAIHNRMAQLRQMRETLLAPPSAATIAIETTPAILNPNEGVTGTTKYAQATADGLADAEARAIGFEEDDDPDGEDQPQTGAEAIDGETEIEATGAEEPASESAAEEGDFENMKYTALLVYAKENFGLTYKKTPNRQALIDDVRQARQSKA